MPLKLGKREAREDHRDLRFAAYAASAVWPKLPSRFGHGKAFADWGMLGNDRVGDCVPAGAAHETMVYNHQAKHDVSFTAPWVIDDYSAVTGYNPADPGTDQGTYVRDYLKFRRATGIADGHGTRHKIAAYVSIAPKDFHQMLVATYIFGAVGIGFQFPSSAWQQFEDGEPWEAVEADEAIEGGHYVCMIGTMASTKKATCITWGRRQELTKAFYETYNDEAWVPLSLEVLNSDGLGLHGYDLATLRADLAAL